MAVTNLNNGFKVLNPRITKNLISGEMGAKHTVLNEEQAAFADWINTSLGNDKDVAHKLRLNVRRERFRDI